MNEIPRFLSHPSYAITSNKAVCVGRNYAEHAKELNNPIPENPLLFIKPSTSITSMKNAIKASQNHYDVHYEAEIALLIGSQLTKVTPSEAVKAIIGVGVGLDLTLRDLQKQLKQNGQPWEKAKAFDHSCVVSDFMPVPSDINWSDLSITLQIDSVTVQQGNSAQMLTPIPQLLSYISNFFTLEKGDIVLTGTPKGVGKLYPRQKIAACLENIIDCNTWTI